MTFNRVRIVCLFLSLAAFSSQAHAQNGVSPASSAYVTDDGTGVATAADFSGSYLIGNDGGTYFLFDKMIGDGPAFDQGFTRFGLRTKLIDRGDSHLWGSGYVLITDDTRVGVNAGGGYRWLNDGNIIGLNAWFDSYSTNNHNRFSQFTAGFEMLRQDYDFRVNGYLPFGDEESFLRVTDPGTEAVFTSNGIGFLGRGLEEQAMKGVDAEVGTEILNVPWARVYGGGYWYDGKSTSFGGFRGRVETAISPDFSVNFIVQHDSEYDTNLNLGLEYRFSGGVTPSFFPPFHGESRKYHPVRRQWPIATRVVDVPTTVPMLSAKTGKALVLAFVDNTNAGPGDGSLENPFSELPASVDSDGILVFTGVGNTLGNITLNDCQFLFGEGAEHTLFDPVRGIVTLPAPFDSDGPRPLLEAANPAQNVVTLANMNHVSNFDILGPAMAAAIGGTDITDFEIDKVSARGARDGINIVNASGRGVIRGSGTVLDPMTMLPVPRSVFGIVDFDVDDRGVFVSNTSGDPLNLTVEDLIVSDSQQGLHVVAANGTDVNATIDGFLADDVTTGVTLDALMMGRLNAIVSDAIVTNSGGLTQTGFALNVMTGGSMAVDMQDIAARGNSDLFVVDVRDGQFNGTVHGGVPGTIAGADFSDSGLGVMGGGSGVRINLENAIGRLSFSSLFANRNMVNGIETDATGAGTDFLIDVRDSRLIANMDSAFHTDVTGGATLRYFVDPTFATMSGSLNPMPNVGSGFEFNVSGPGTVFIADILQTDFTDSAAHAIDGHVYDGAYANVDVTDILGDSAGLNGYNLLVEQGAQFIGTATNASFTLAGDAGIDVSVAGGSSASLMMTDIMGQTNGDYGLRFNVDDGVMGPSDLFLSVTNGDFNSNPDSNIMGLVDGPGSIGSIYLNNVSADDMAANGSVILTAQNGGVLNTNWNVGSVSQGDADGFVLNVDGAGSQLRLNLEAVSIGTNAFDGIDGTLSNGGADSRLDISLVNSGVTLNGGNGIDLAIDGPGAQSTLLIDNSPVIGNFGGDGLEFDVTNGAGLGVLAFGAASDFSGNLARAWDGSVDGMGSYATVTIDSANAIGSGLEGGLFEVTNGGLLNLNLSNLIIGDNPLDGLLTTVDGAGSLANITMSGVTIQRNGLSLVGDGIEARATNGGGINAMLSNMSVVENREDGFLFDASTGGVILARLENIIGDDNGRHGLEFHARTGGQFSGEVFGASFSQAGSIFIGNGVFGTARDAGSVASILLDGVVADNSSRMGFEFDVRTGATLLADIRSGGAFGDSSGSGNAGDGVRFYAQDPGTMGFLKMMGPNAFDNNVGNGINYDAVNVDMAVAGVSGTMNGNGLDGINIAMIDVTSGAISLQGVGPASISGNGGDGINISTQNVNLIEKTVNGMLIDDFLIDGFTIDGNGGDPIVVSMGNTTVQDGAITNNTTTGGLNGILVTLNGGAVNMVIDNNIVSDAMQYGIAVTSGSGMHNVEVTNNSVTSSGDTNIFVDLFGTTETGLMIDNNTIIGGGTGQAMFTIGTNFTGTTALTSPSPFISPPDTMGGVGNNHIIEILNNGYAVYDKATGMQLFTSGLEQFFIDAGLPARGAGEFVTDPRVVFDPTVNRWFVVAIDANPANIGTASNNVLLAVSLTDNPLDGFTGLEFVADTVDMNRLGDYPTLGVDADGVYITTNNFNPGFSDVSVYSIPKADLLAAVPTLANMTRFEVTDSTMFGDTIQPVIDFGPSDGITNLLATEGFGGGSNLVRADITGSGGPGAVLGAPVDVPVLFYAPGPPGLQPSGALLDNVSPRFGSNVVKVGGSIWAAHAVQGVTGTSAVRWYEIDATTNTVLQTGEINDPQLDFLDPSIAVNAAGAVVIGFTGTGLTQSASSMAAYGSTDAMGVTTFQAPQILQAGIGSYNTGGGFSRWGDYSATVVDPNDPNTFWTFQEFSNGGFDFGVQITQINFTQAVLGGTANDGIHVDVRDMAHMTPSTINGNSVTNQRRRRHRGRRYR